MSTQSGSFKRRFLCRSDGKFLKRLVFSSSDQNINHPHQALSTEKPGIVLTQGTVKSMVNALQLWIMCINLKPIRLHEMCLRVRPPKGVLVYCFLVILCLFFQNAAFSQEKKFLVRDLFYNSSNQLSRSGDLYLPHESSPSPLVILIHGGGWTAGDKSAPEIRFLSQRLAAAGYAVFDVNYRLIQDGGTFPSNIRDIGDAISFVYKNSKKYNLDQNRIAIMGDSAGGYLALMVAFCADQKIFKDKEINQSRRIKCAICYYPVTDMAHLNKGFVTAYMEDTEVHSPQLYKSAEPITYVANSVPTLLIHGTRDNIVPIEHSEKFIDVLKRHDQDAYLVSIAGAGHGFRIGVESDTAFVEAQKFLDRYLKNQQLTQL